MAVNSISVHGLDPWAILGLAPHSSPEEVSGAMKLLAKAIHPDILPRGAALMQIVQSAAEACQHGGAWPVAHAPMLTRPGMSYPPKAPPVPRAPMAPERGGAPVWRKTKKGGWTKRIRPDTWVNVYLAKDCSGWRFLGPDADGNTYFDAENFHSAEAAMAAADEYFRG